MTIVAVGIDLAKHVFAVHGVDQADATLAPCLIGMEACTGAHHWARQFLGHGHTELTAAVQLDRAASSDRRERG